jgi:hypothetical protein
MPQRDGGVEWKGGHQWRFVQRMAVGLSLLYIRVGSKPFNHPKARQNAACPTPSALLSPKRLFGGSSILPTKSIPAASLLLLSLVIAKRVVYATKWDNGEKPLQDQNEEKSSIFMQQWSKS